MCDADYGETSAVWKETTQRARKAYRCCSECGQVIVAGTMYVRIGSLYAGSWTTTRCHVDCIALVKMIAFDVCGQHAYYLDSEHLASRVREHMDDHPEVLVAYREILRARAREQGWRS